MKKRASEMGTTTITPPQKRLLRKFDREGVMGRTDFAGVDLRQCPGVPRL
jgi:hypothetical protein